MELGETGRSGLGLAGGCRQWRGHLRPLRMGRRLVGCAHWAGKIQGVAGAGAGAVAAVTRRTRNFGLRFRVDGWMDGRDTVDGYVST